jgi:hypothetical protein
MPATGAAEPTAAETTEPRINTKLAVESNASTPITVTVGVENEFEETVTLNPRTVRDFTDRLERGGSYDVRASTPEDTASRPPSPPTRAFASSSRTTARCS